MIENKKELKKDEKVENTVEFDIKACSYAAYILADDGIEITVFNLLRTTQFFVLYLQPCLLVSRSESLNLF